MNIELARALVATLPVKQPNLFNPWADQCVHDLAHNTPEAKVRRLAQHLACEPRLILCGEAPGFQGCRYTGLSFTSERLLMAGAIPRVEPLADRITSRTRPFSEPSATIVWKQLYALGIAETTLLWNAVQLHPVGQLGEWSNRTPDKTEIALGAPALSLLTRSFPDAKLIAVGRKAEVAMAALGIQPAAAVRHPANGGATAFATGLADAIHKLAA